MSELSYLEDEIMAMEAEIERLTAALEAAEKTIQEERGSKWTVLDSVWKRRAEDAEAALRTARADALREAADDLQNKHESYMKSKGRNPHDYTSRYATAAIELYDLIENGGDA